MSTPLQYSGSRVSLFSDSPFQCSAETPLVGMSNKGSSDTLLVSRDVIRAYQQVILRLELQVLHYQTLLRQIARSPEPAEEMAVQVSSPLNEASVHLVSSILHARVSNDSILRAFDDEEV